jgi:uncharacterized protein (TIGR04255 family)
MPWPKRLEPDPIAEALFEMHFDSTESAQLPDLVVARLFDNPNWRTAIPQRLPIADIPAPIRAQDPSLRFQPVLQVHDAINQRLVRIGPNSLSYHVLPPYPGGIIFKEELMLVVDFVFRTLTKLSVQRLGFKYVNLVTPDQHGVNSIADLNFSVHLNKERLHAPMVLTYQREHKESHTAIVRISSPAFVQGVPVGKLSALIDVDIMTPAGFSAEAPNRVLEWVDEAHRIEKEFFGLLSRQTLKQLGRE